MKRRAQYLTSCVGLGTDEVADLLWMQDTAVEVQYHCFVRNTDWKPLARQLGYAVDPGEKGLRMTKDWHIRFYKSTWKGEECYYLKHSAIEYIFTRPAREGAANDSSYGERRESA